MRATVDEVRAVIELRFPFSKATNERLKSLNVGARWSKARRAWTVPASATVTVALGNEFGVIEGDEAYGELERLARCRVQAASERSDTPPEIPRVRTRAWKHQKEAFHFIACLWGGVPEEPGRYETGASRPAAYFGAMGCGKSKVAIDLLVNFGFRRTLILAPKCVVGVWPSQFEEHSSELVDVLAQGAGPSRTRKLELSRFLRSAGTGAVILNYEAAWREPLRTFLLETPWELLITDEHHRLKAPQGRASLFVYQLSKRIPYKLALTGTPLPHSPLDAFATYRCLDPGIFGTSYVKFRDRYAVMSRGTPSFPVGYRNLDELHERMYQIALRVTKEEALELPAVTHVERRCELGRVAAKAYAELEDELYTKLERGEVTAANQLVKLTRLRQVTSGYLRDDDGVEVFVDDSKEKLLADVLEDLPQREPLVVFCVFHHDLDAVRRVCAKQGRRYAELSGRARELELWQSGEAEVIGVQIQAGGVGISLVRAAYAVYYSVGFSLSEFEQSLARLHRPGQKRKVTFYHLTAKDTVDVRIYEALRARKNVVETVLQEIRRRVAA